LRLIFVQVGVLIPLNESFEKDNSLPELQVLVGDNVLGRNNISVIDKRLSRKHITLSTSADSADGFADLLVVIFDVCLCNFFSVLAVSVSFCIIMHFAWVLGS